MIITCFPSAEEVKRAKAADDILIGAISFDGKKAYVSSADISPEHHILLANAGEASGNVDKFFRIVFDSEGADWTFVCPPDYKNIPFKDKRVEAFYKDGFALISDFLREMGYNVQVNIPKRYKRHFDILNHDTY